MSKNPTYPAAAIPYLMIRGAAEALDFYKEAFAVSEEVSFWRSDGEKGCRSRGRALEDGRKGLRGALGPGPSPIAHCCRTWLRKNCHITPVASMCSRAQLWPRPSMRIRRTSASLSQPS